MGYIKKIFEGEIDQEVHDEFTKYGKGEFSNRYEIRAKEQKNGKQYKIWTSHEFSNFLVKRCMEKASDEVDIKGIMIATFDIEDDIKCEIKDVKKYMGMYKYIINTTANKQDVLDLMNKYPKIFYGLSFDIPNGKLKVKKKSPRSAKPGSSKKDKKERKVNFCSMKTQDMKLVKNLLFDIDLDFEEVKISHDLIINNIIYPENMSELKPKEIREKAKREGKIIRHIYKDDREEKKETDFVA